MSLYRDDVGSEESDCNTARRKFWEMCASRQPQIYQTETGDYGLYYIKEDTDDLAKWADLMLAEWDKRWIADKLLVLNCSIDDLLDKMEEASAGGSLQSSCGLEIKLLM